MNESRWQRVQDLFWSARELPADARDEMLRREGRTALAEAAFDFLSTRARLDLDGFGAVDIFAHS